MKVLLNSPGYTYDVHSLIKAFYTDLEVKIDEQTQECQCDDGYDIEIYVSEGDIGKDVIASGNIECIYNVALKSDAHLPSKYDEAYMNEGRRVSKLMTFSDCDRTQVKNQLKICLYSLLSEINGVELPWGTLTGIRPTKIPMKMIREGEDDDTIRAYMKDVYRCSDEKIELSLDIAHLELELVNQADEEGFSLYVGIPFCPTTCLYCSFTSYPIISWAKKTGEYLDALKKELDYVAQEMSHKKADSIYIGGGTPTTLSAYELEDLIQYIRSKFDCSNVKEFTVEAGRPDSITEEKLRALYNNGISRLSINPQTMNEETLKVIGRRHSVEQVVEAFQLARKVGFDNINMDLILGLPGEDISKVAYTLERVKELSPDSITVHSMAIKRAAGMHQFLQEHTEYESVNTPEMMALAQKYAEDMGMKPYYLYRQKNMTGNFENVGYAREGKYGVYNILIMEEVQTIVACGAGTVTKRVYGDGRIERCDNVKDVNLYISKIEEMIDRKRELFKD